jgi:hypothetical protein
MFLFLLASYSRLGAALRGYGGCNVSKWPRYKMFFDRRIIAEDSNQVADTFLTDERKMRAA